MFYGIFVDIFCIFCIFCIFLNICAWSQYGGGLARIHPVHPAAHRYPKARSLSKPFSAYYAYSYYTTTGAGGCTSSNMRTSGQSLSGHVGLALILILVWELEAFTNHLSEWVEQISWICKICKICWICQICTIHWIFQIWICKIWNPHRHTNPPFAYDSEPPLF